MKKKPTKKRDRTAEYARDKKLRRQRRAFLKKARAIAERPTRRPTASVAISALKPENTKLSRTGLRGDQPLTHSGIGRDEKAPVDMTRPPHYTALTPEPIKVIESWNLDFHRGNAVKYIARAPHKGNFVGDLKKAVQYLQWKIAQLEGK